MKTLLAMIVLGAVLFAVSLYAFATQRGHPSASTAAPAGATLVFIDLTDSLSPGQRRFVAEELHRVGERLRRGERLWVYILSGHAPSPRPLWAATNPGRAQDANPLTEGAQYLELRFEAEVIQRLDSLMAAITVPDTSKTSAILEGLWQVSNYSDFAHETGPKHLVVISDFIQNTPTFSLYRPGQTSFFAPSGQLRDPAWEATLSGTTAEAFCLLRPRDAHLQGPKLFAEWTRYFQHCGTEPVFSVVPS